MQMYMTVEDEMKRFEEEGRQELFMHGKNGDLKLTVSSGSKLVS